ncbi:MAG: ABC transporter substrate-binding protein, partial [Vulcanimicrobiaceae bacterium]
MLEKFEGSQGASLSRGAILASGAGLAATTLWPAAMAGAAGEAPIGTWPDGTTGSTVSIGAAFPLTGTYAVQGEDERKGFELAVQHLNEGDSLIRKIAPKVTKGLLGKQVQLLVADSGAKPNDAVQEQQKFITDNKVILMTGATSSAVAVALNKFAQRSKVLYVTGISGSNDTTGKDCVRYGFRQNFYGETAANAIGPVLIKRFGKNRKA